MNGVWIRMAAIKLTILRLASAPGISLPICPSSSTFAIQTFLDPVALCEVSRLSKEDLNANAIKNVHRDKVSVRALRFCIQPLSLCYTLFIQSQCVLLLVLWCQDDHSSLNSLTMRDSSCGPYSLKVVTSRFARYLGTAVEIFTDPCD